MAEQETKEYTLLEIWRGNAYSAQKTQQEANKFWAQYFTIEKGIYEKILAEPEVVVEGTVKELAEKYGVDVLVMVGFLDGINDSLKNPNPIETMTEDTVVNLGYDIELLYKNIAPFFCLVCRIISLYKAGTKYSRQYHKRSIVKKIKKYR